MVARGSRFGNRSDSTCECPCSSLITRRRNAARPSLSADSFNPTSRVATVPVSVPFSVPSKICKKFPVLRF